jgi:hypothetical protein
MHGLNTYDYGARQYNPVTARWDRVDPLCEKYYSVSPYAYCGNNPMRYIDPDGMKGIPYHLLQRRLQNIAFLGVGFSVSDLTNLREHASEGLFVSIVEAGSKRYAAIISDPEKAIEFFKSNSDVDIENIYNQTFNNSSEKSVQRKIDKAILSIVGDGSKSGITVFIADDAHKRNFRILQ